MSGFDLRAAHARIVGPAIRRSNTQQANDLSISHGGDGAGMVMDSAPNPHRTLGAKHPFPLGCPPIVSAVRNTQARSVRNDAVSTQSAQFRVSQSWGHTPASDAGRYGQMRNGRKFEVNYSFPDRQALSIYRRSPELEARIAEDERVWHCWWILVFVLILALLLAGLS